MVIGLPQRMETVSPLRRAFASTASRWVARIVQNDVGGGFRTCRVRAAMRGGASATIGNIVLRAGNCMCKSDFHFGVISGVFLRRGGRNCGGWHIRGPESAIKKRRSTSCEILGSPATDGVGVCPITCVQGGCKEASRPRATLFPRRDTPGFASGVLANRVSSRGRDMGLFCTATLVTRPLR